LALGVKSVKTDNFFGYIPPKIWKILVGIQTFRFGKFWLESKPSDLENFGWNPNLSYLENFGWNPNLQIWIT